MLKFNKLNFLMENALSSINSDNIKSVKMDTKYFFDLFNANIVESNGAILFENSIDSQYNPANYTNFSAYEASKNTVHITDFLDDDNVNSVTIFCFGLVFFELIFLKLKVSFPNKNFILYLSYDPKNEFGYCDCLVSFYQNRVNEIYLPDNLNEFANDAVGILFVN